MSLENIVKRVKNILVDSLLAGSLLSSSFLLNRCGRITEPNGDENGYEGYPPSTPSVIETIPYKEEPQRIIQLLMQDNSNDENGFVLERKKAGGYFEQLSSFSSKEGTGKRFLYNDGNLEKSTTYTYRLKAYNEFGNSEWDEKSATSLGPQNGSIGVKTTADTYVRQAQPTQNFGDRKCLYLSKGHFDVGSGPDDQQEIFLAFSLPQLPSYSVGFKSATLGLIDASGGNTLYPGDLTIYVGEVWDPWDENTVTWDTKPDVLYYPSEQVAVHDPRNQDYVLINVSKTVSNWYSNIIPNRGFGLTTISDDRYVAYYSKEGYPPGSASLAIVYEW